MKKSLVSSLVGAFMLAQSLLPNLGYAWPSRSDMLENHKLSNTYCYENPNVSCSKEVYGEFKDIIKYKDGTIEAKVQNPTNNKWLKIVLYQDNQFEVSMNPKNSNEVIGLEGILNPDSEDWLNSIETNKQLSNDQYATLVGIANLLHKRDKLNTLPKSIVEYK